MDLARPRISVLLPAFRGLESVRCAIAAWDAQTRRDQLEVLVLCPHAWPEGVVGPDTRILDAAGLSLHAARALGMREAQGDYVMIAEDHCLPDPDMAEHVLESIDAGWDLIAPSLRSADPRTSAARAGFVIGYSQWMEPVQSGERRVLPGHNTVLRRAAVLAVGDELEEHLRAASFLSRHLIDQGCRGYLNSAARMRHFDSRSWFAHLKIFLCIGLAFGALRTRDWPRIARVAYPLAAPAVIARHYARASRQLRRAPAYPRTRPGIAVLALVWGLCEGIGAIAGVPRTSRTPEITEIKPIDATDVARADAFALAQNTPR